MQKFTIIFKYEDEKEQKARVVKNGKENNAEYIIDPLNSRIVQKFGKQIIISKEDGIFKTNHPLAKDFRLFFETLIEALKKQEKEVSPGYPSYSQDEDIYSKEKELQNIDPENTSSTKNPMKNPNAPNEKDADDESRMGGDLDVPGKKKNEKIGEEDEENNYYSLGGDRHEE